jgi:hypothetical protein
MVQVAPGAPGVLIATSWVVPLVMVAQATSGVTHATMTRQRNKNSPQPKKTRSNAQAIPKSSVEHIENTTCNESSYFCSFKQPLH